MGCKVVVYLVQSCRVLEKSDKGYWVDLGYVWLGPRLQVDLDNGKQVRHLCTVDKDCKILADFHKVTKALIKTSVEKCCHWLGKGLHGRHWLGQGLQGRQWLGQGLQGRQWLGQGLQGPLIRKRKAKSSLVWTRFHGHIWWDMNARLWLIGAN